jgi:hypothetical protein
MVVHEKNQAAKYLREQIAKAEDHLAVLRADEEALKDYPPETPTWHCAVISAWSSEGEPSWSGDLQAVDLREAVYEAMLAFCKKAKRVFPGHKGSTGKVYDFFDVQGDVLVALRLPNGSLIPADNESVEKLKREFKRKASAPKPVRKRPKGITS